MHPQTNRNRLHNKKSYFTNHYTSEDGRTSHICIKSIKNQNKGVALILLANI